MDLNYGTSECLRAKFRWFKSRTAHSIRSLDVKSEHTRIIVQSNDAIRRNSGAIVAVFERTFPSTLRYLYFFAVYEGTSAVVFVQAVEYELCNTEGMDMATMVEQNKELARRDIEEVWNEDNLDLIDEFYAEDFVHHDPNYPDEIRGPEGQKEFVRAYNTAFPGDISIDELVSEENTVTVRWTGHGMHEGEFMGIEPTHEEIQVTGMSMARIEDGEIVEMWTSYDALGILLQLGAIEVPTA